MSRASFANADVRAASLSGGSVYFLYTPFRGRMLTQVLDRLEREATTPLLRVCTLGACTFEVAQASWLHADCEAPLSADEVTVFRRC